MTYQQTHCLIIFRHERGLPDHWAGIHLQSSSGVTRIGAAGVSTRTVKAVTLLPVAFCNSHQSVVSHLNKNGVHIARNGDELRIDEEVNLCVIECLLGENLDEMDSLPMELTYNLGEWERYHLEQLFDKTSLKLKFREKYASCTNALTRPAIDDQNTEVFQFLIRGCRYYYGPDYFTPFNMHLLLAAIINYQDLLVKLLFDHVANVNAAELIDALNALHFAVAKESGSAIVELLLEKGAHVDARNRERKTPLHFAAMENCLNNAKILLQNGADADARCYAGRTPLHSASFYVKDSSKLVQLLIDEGASVNQTDKNGLTPLHYVKSPETAKTLLENGADLNCEDNMYKRTPLMDKICLGYRPDLIKVFLDYGSRIDFKFDSNMGLSINGAYVFQFEVRMNESVLEYLLNRCFVHVDLEYSNEHLKLVRWDFYLVCIFARHLVRVVSLNLKDRYSFDPADFWVEMYHEQPLSAFKEQCEMEVSRMKSQLIADTDLNVYELLAMDEHQVARLLRNQSVTLDTDELKKMFPTYGLMLTCTVEKGRNRFAWQEQGIVSCNLLSGNFKRMPDEIKENFMRRLSIADIRSVKKACAFLS